MLGYLPGLDSERRIALLATLRRKDTRESYREFVEGLAKQAGESVSTVEELIDFDRKRPGKSLSSKDGEHPVDPDARVACMKDGATDMARKAEHCVRFGERGAAGGDGVGGGQGLEQRRGDRGAGGERRGVVRGGAAAGASQLVGQGRGAGVGGGEPGARGERTRPGAGRSADGEGGAVDGAHVRDGRAAEGVLAGAREHPQAAAGPRVRIQSGHVDAGADGDRYASHPAGTGPEPLGIGFSADFRAENGDLAGSRQVSARLVRNSIDSVIERSLTRLIIR